jgi:hypothetical protein
MGKKNNDFQPVRWTRHFSAPPQSGILSDAVGYMYYLLAMEKYPGRIVSLW